MLNLKSLLADTLINESIVFIANIYLFKEIVSFTLFNRESLIFSDKISNSWLLRKLAYIEFGYSDVIKFLI